MNYTPLTKDFYSRDTHIVARNLLGKILVRNWRGTLISGRITEVEAYVGEDDKACHASRGHTSRTEVLYGDAGHAYIYLIYGMYHCFNIVTEYSDFPAAVLIRSLAPLAGLPQMEQWRKTTEISRLTTGPGKLCQALNITKQMHNEDITNSQHLFVINDGKKILRKNVAASARIGVDYAGDHAHLPWRYFIKNSPFLSR